MAKHREHVNAQCHTMSRADVADRLGVSTSTVRRLEFNCLHPVLDERGTWRFDPAEVDMIEAMRGTATKTQRNRRRDRFGLSGAFEGKVAAKVFRMFARRMALPQIVMATKQHPDVIRNLYREWSTTLEKGEFDRRLADDA